VPKSNPTTDIFWQRFSKFQGCAQRCLLLVQSALFDGVMVEGGVCGGGGVCMCVERWGGVSGRLKESLLGGVWIVEVTLGVVPGLFGPVLAAVMETSERNMREDPRNVRH